MKEQLSIQCVMHWWNFGTKTLAFKGTLEDLLKQHNITFTKRKTHIEGFYIFSFKSIHGVTFKVQGAMYNFAHYAKQFIQMELVRMGDKATLCVPGAWRPTVTVNH